MATDFDIMIIGGGIHGAGIAQAAAINGYTTLLIEKNKFASATSSKSSKLIHGGLRYLESLQFSVVKECLNERATLLKIAPQLVKLTPFHIPVYQHTTRRAWQLHIGLTLYRMLAHNKDFTGYKKINRELWNTLDHINLKGLQHVFQYYDAQTDDAELTRSVIKSAKHYGAICEENATLLKGKITAEKGLAQYGINDKTIKVSAKVIINACGPWVNEIINKFEYPHAEANIDLVQGTHIYLDAKTTKGCYYTESPSDKRAIFIMPWKQGTLVGTTETMFNQNPDQCIPLDAEVDYLINCYQHYFPNQPIHLLDTFAGLRVLPKVDTRAFNRSRETIYLYDNKTKTKFISVVGGKLTSYRSDAEKLMKKIHTSLNAKKPYTSTNEIKL